MYLVIIILPLLGSFASGFFGRKIGVKGSQLITCSCITITTIFSLIAFSEVGFNNIPVSLELFRWIDSESINILYYFNFDSLTISMLIPVLIISSLVHLYSIGYMSSDPHIQRFFSYLSLFTFMMIILVTSNNFLLMFVGWEGVGVCSYLLVSFWYTRIAANQSSLSAFLTNRVGDCFLTIGMFILLLTFGNIDYSTVFSLSPYINENIITIIGICLLIGAMAKSSQIGLHIWLPQAMEGPTPVSALIHAATMVTAGVYLLMRSSPIIEYSSTVLILCLWIGAITTIFSSLIGLFQQDIKKVIAYSTMSQLGMMVIAVGLSCYNIALFHLINHAFYKGLLFLAAGSIIHAVSDNQDFRKFGGLRIFLPLTYSVMLIASLSLVAFPFMSGFFSKDLILESSFGQFFVSGITVYTIATIAAIFTTLYSVKVLYLTFFSNPNGPLVNYKKAHEGNLFMNSPLIILAIFSIFFGFLTKEIFIGLGSQFFADNSLFIHPLHEIMIDTEFAVYSIFKLLPFILTIIAILFAILISEFFQKFLIYFKYSNIGYNIFSFFNQRSLVEFFYNKKVIEILKIGGQSIKIIDKGSIELLGPYGLESIVKQYMSYKTKLNFDMITTYALYILTSFIVYIILNYFTINSQSILILIVFGLITVVINNYKFVGNNYYILHNKTLFSGIAPGLTSLIVGCTIIIFPTLAGLNISLTIESDLFESAKPVIDFLSKEHPLITALSFTVFSLGTIIYESTPLANDPDLVNTVAEVAENAANIAQTVVTTGANTPNTVTNAVDPAIVEAASSSTTSTQTQNILSTAQAIVTGDSTVIAAGLGVANQVLPNLVQAVRGSNTRTLQIPNTTTDTSVLGIHDRVTHNILEIVRYIDRVENNIDRVNTLIRTNNIEVVIEPNLMLGVIGNMDEEVGRRLSLWLQNYDNTIRNDLSQLHVLIRDNARLEDEIINQDDLYDARGVDYDDKLDVLKSKYAYWDRHVKK